MANRKGVIVMGKFVISNAKSGGVKFNLVAGNGEIIATSEVYNSKASAKKGIASIQKNAGSVVEDQTKEGYTVEKHPKFELYQDKAGEFRFRLKAANGEIIAASQGYSSKSGCQNGIDSVKRNAPDAEIVDETTSE